MLCTKSHIYVAKVTKKHVCVVKCCWILSLVRHHAMVHISQTCPGDFRRAIRASLAYLESFSGAPRILLLQRFEIMRLPSDAFAWRRLQVTLVMRFKFHYKFQQYYVFNFWVFIRVVTVKNSRRINHMETNFNQYRDDLSYQYVTASRFPEVSHEIPVVSHEIRRNRKKWIYTHIYIYIYI